MVCARLQFVFACVWRFRSSMARQGRMSIWMLWRCDTELLRSHPAHTAARKLWSHCPLTAPRIGICLKCLTQHDHVPRGSGFASTGREWFNFGSRLLKTGSEGESTEKTAVSLLVF